MTQEEFNKEALFLISKIKTGVAIIRAHKNFDCLIGYDVLPQIETLFEDFVRRSDESVLNQALNLFKASDVSSHKEGASSFGTSVWNTDISVEGKTTILGYFLQDLDELLVKQLTEE